MLDKKLFPLSQGKVLKQSKDVMVNNFINMETSTVPSNVKKASSIKKTTAVKVEELEEDSGRINDENLDFYHLLSSNILKIKESLREMSNVPLNDEDQKVKNI